MAAAAAHAAWNLIAKQAGGGAVFVWLFSLCGFVLLLPIALAQSLPGLDAEALGLMEGDAPRRIGAAVAIVAGLVMLAVG